MLQHFFLLFNFLKVDIGYLIVHETNIYRKHFEFGAIERQFLFFIYVNDLTRDINTFDIISTSPQLAIIPG